MWVAKCTQFNHLSFWRVITVISRYGIVLIYFGDEERRYRLPIAKGRSVTVRDIIEAATKTISTNFGPLRDDERFSSIPPFFAAIELVPELGLIWCILDTLPESFAVKDHQILMTFGCQLDSDSRRSRLTFLILRSPRRDMEACPLNRRINVCKFTSPFLHFMMYAS